MGDEFGNRHGMAECRQHVLFDVTDVEPDVIPGAQPPQQIDAGRSLVISDVLIDLVTGKDEHSSEMV